MARTDLRNPAQQRLTNGGQPEAAGAVTATANSEGSLLEPAAPVLSDAELVAAGLRGDESAYGELVRRYSNIVVGFAFNRVSDFQLAEDLAQETFVKAYESLGSLNAPEKFGSWLLVIARHTCMDWLRASKDVVSLDGLRDSGHEPVSGSGRENFDRLSDEEVDARILTEVQTLREDYRDIIVMKHIQQLSYKQIGELLGMSVSAVGEKLSRVRQILRKRLTGTIPGV